MTSFLTSGGVSTGAVETTRTLTHDVDFIRPNKFALSGWYKPLALQALIGVTGEFIWLFLVIFGYFWLFLVIFGYFRMGNSSDGVFCLFTGGTERFGWNAPGSFERTTLRRTATCGCARVWGRMATV